MPSMGALEEREAEQKAARRRSRAKEAAKGFLTKVGLKTKKVFVENIEAPAMKRIENARRC
jgi:hypothetical protein